MLLPRIITAIIGIPLILIAVHQGKLPYICFIGLIIILSLYEYALILKLGGKSVARVPLFIFGAGLAAAAVFDRSPVRPAGGDNVIPLVISLMVLGCLSWEIFSKRRSLERVALTVFGIFFISWNLVHLVHLRDIRPDGEFITYMLFITVWIMDTAAYVIGRLWGKKRMAQGISPKKTWEGAVGGFIAAVICAVVVRNILLYQAMSAGMAAGIGALIGITGQLSDMAESMVKRSVGVKDSSNLLPGHGGVLDRFDSFLLSAPILYYVLIFMG